jgi:hypothetical protein
VAIIKSKSSKALACAVCAMALSFGTAKANSFDVNGTYSIPSSGTLSGTLNIDVIAGTVISADIIVQGFPEFTTGLLSGPVSLEHRRKNFLNIEFLELVLIQPRLAETAMLQNLSNEVRECLRRAEECKRLAKTGLTPSAIKDYLDMEHRWLNLARSYEFQALFCRCRHQPRRPRSNCHSGA